VTSPQHWAIEANRARQRLFAELAARQVTNDHIAGLLACSRRRVQELRYNRVSLSVVEFYRLAAALGWSITLCTDPADGTGVTNGTLGGVESIQKAAGS
jgi:hypothetical protein